MNNATTIVQCAGPQKELGTVLDEPENLGGFRQGGGVIRRHCEYLAHAQVHPAFAGPNVADAIKQLVKAVRHG